MRTKILLASAAVLAAGLMASNAQVYSANVVGYANVTIAGNGEFTLVANPFDDGNGNQLTNLMNSALPNASQVLTWDPVNQFTTFQKGGTAHVWLSNTNLPPGIGFFVRNGAPGGGAPAVTNTFVGSVICLVGNTVTNPVPLGYSLQGSPIPYVGSVAISGSAGGSSYMDFGDSVTNGSQILTWDPVAQYTTVQKGGTAHVWLGTATVGVGQGFFLYNKNGPSNNVVEGL